MRYTDLMNNHQRPAIGLVELLIVIVVIFGLFYLITASMTGTGGTIGAKEFAERSIQHLQMRDWHNAFFMYGMDHNDKYPSTDTEGRMTDDTTSQVFSVLIDEGTMVPQQLVSPNEYDDQITIGSRGSIGPFNHSFAMCDYDADDWLRYPMWNNTSGRSLALISDRWVDDPVIEDVHNLQDAYWNVLFNDGSTDTTDSGSLPNGDSLFDPDSGFGDQDNLNVHD